MNCESLLEEQITLTIIVMRMSLSAMGWFDSVSFAFTTIVDNSICNLFVILSLTLSLYRKLYAIVIIAHVDQPFLKPTENEET